MKAVSRKVWEAFWNHLHSLGTSMRFNEYCKVCDQIKADFQKEHDIPFGFMSNGRYAVYANDVLKAGGEVSEEDLKTIVWGDIRYDWYEFNPLIDACAKVGNIVEDVEKKKREKALNWWNELSQIEQHTFIEKHVTDYFDKSSALSGNVSSFLALHIMLKEGVA